MDAVILALIACHGADDSDSDGGTTAPPGVCADANAAFGATVCVDTVPDVATWQSITVPAGASVVRATKFVAPASADARIPTIFLDAHTFQLHYDALVQGFPEIYGGLVPPQYLALVLDPVERELYAGGLEELPDGTFAFTILDDAAVPASTVTAADVEAVHAELIARWGLGGLAFRPSTANQELAAERWELDFPIVGLEPVDYEVYSTGVGFGTVRHYTPEEFAAAEAEAAYSFEDVLFLDEGPVDVSRPVSGAVTGTRQAALSHLSVRSASRGTPDCYVADLPALVAAWDGQLVRLECGVDALTVRAATLDEAEEFWASIRPVPLDVDPPDYDETAMPGLLELDVGLESARDLAKRRYGVKGTNLATLYQGIDADLRLDGFVIPLSAYHAFVTTAGWTVDLGDGPRLHTFQETIDAWAVDPAFAADGRLRVEQLGAMQAAMRAAPVDPAIIADIGARVDAVFGTAPVAVRFRSSSNAEDALGFSGAGLYDSASGCIADDRDGDRDGPSACDADRDDERTVEDALREVWASLWNVRAWEERAWYGIDPRLVGMGVLVDTRVEDERANLVAFSGDPATDDDRVRIDAQAGETEVVSDDPGIVPESLRVEVEGGEVVDVERLTWSSEVPFGTPVLTDDEVATIAVGLTAIAAWFPLDDVVPDGHDVVWDTEWKVDPEGRVVIKQIRPFLR
jgi:pyruvate,water dikinase